MGIVFHICLLFMFEKLSMTMTWFGGLHFAPDVLPVGGSGSAGHGAGVLDCALVFPVRHGSQSVAPRSFGGMSGGGLWQVPLKRDEQPSILSHSTWEKAGRIKKEGG